MEFSSKNLNFRSSRFGDLCGSVTKMELTDKQKETMAKYDGYDAAGKALTPNQQDERNKLIEKRDAKPSLDLTGKKWVQELFRDEIRRTYSPGFTGSRVTEKGDLCEQSAIDRVCRIMGWGESVKSAAHFNDHIGSGHPDLYKPAFKIGADVKCSWSDASFPLFDKTLKNPMYEVQAKRYCMQSKLPEWWVVYSLENTPEHLIIQEAQRLWKEAGNPGFIKLGETFISPLAESFYQETKELHNFDHLADWERVKPFKVTLTEADVQFFNKRAEMGREYADELLIEYQHHKLYIQQLKRV